VIAPERTGACLNFPARIKLSRQHQAGNEGPWGIRSSQWWRSCAGLLPGGGARARTHRVQPVVAVMRVSFLPFAWVGDRRIRSSQLWRSCAGLLPGGGARVRTHRVQPVVAVIADLLSCVRAGGGQADQVQPVVAVIAGLLPAVRAGADRQITSSQSSRSSRISLSSRVGDWQRDDQVQPVVALMARPPSCGYAIGA